MPISFQYHRYDLYGLPLPNDLEYAFVDLEPSLDTGKAMVKHDSGFQAFLIVSLNPSSQLYLLWETFTISDINEYVHDNGKTRFTASGDGWMLNPPQLLSGHDFEQFKADFPGQFGYQRLAVRSASQRTCGPVP